MIVSYERNFLFVHVPKTGGTSIRAVLGQHCHNPKVFWSNRVLAKVGIEVNYLTRDYRKLQFRTHDRIANAQRLLPTDVYERLFKFAFVRNPWDLLVSLFKFIRKTESHKRHRLVSKMEFSEFIDFAVTKQIAHQSRLISDNRGNILTDFIGRFENLTQDVQIILQKTGIPAKLPHLNRTPTSCYQDFYSALSKEKVAIAYQVDIDAFEYEFDGRSVDKIAG